MTSRAAKWAAREIASGLAAPYTNRLADAAVYATDGYEAFDRARRGRRGLHDAYAGAPIMGGEWAHGGGDRTAAIEQIGTDMAAFQANLVEAGGNGCAAAVQLASELSPMLAEWHNFVQRMASSPLAAYVMNWKIYERWWDRLHRARELARSRGVILTSPDPVPLPKTVWQRGADGTGSTLDAWISLGRKLFFGTLAVTGAVGLYSAIHRTRTDLRHLRESNP